MNTAPYSAKLWWWLYAAAALSLYTTLTLPYIGEEAVACGAIGAINETDYIASTHRGHGHLIAKGGDLDKMSAEMFMKETGYNFGYGGSMHITDMSKGIMGMNGIVGATFYLASGAAIRAKVYPAEALAGAPAVLDSHRCRPRVLLSRSFHRRTTPSSAIRAACQRCSSPRCGSASATTACARS